MANGIAVMPRLRKTPTEPLTFALSRLSTPIGTALVATDAEGRLRIFEWEDHADRMQSLLDRFYGAGRARFADDRPAAKPVMKALEQYFAGDLAAIDAIAAESAGTEFQRAVWKALRKIPVGQTWSYSRLAQRIGRPDAVRAVGTANGANPISVVVPCHRVIGADGSLTGYGGGMERKAWLLRHEGAIAADTTAQRSPGR